MNRNKVKPDPSPPASTYSGSRMIAKVVSGVTQYFLSDRLSVRLSLDSSGNVSGRQGHLPFGENFAESGTQQKQHFTTYERDSETGLDYAVNRGYAPNLGRFQQADPYKASGYMVDPQSWNRYSYAMNDSLNGRDPLGLFPILYIPVFLGPESIDISGNVGGGFDMGGGINIVQDPPVPGIVPVTPIPPPPPPRPTLPPGTNKGEVKDFNKAWDALIAALDKPACAALFGGKEKAYATLASTKFSYGDLGRAEADESGTVHVVGAQTVGNEVTLNTQGPFRNTNILVHLPDGRVVFRPVDFGANVASGAQFGSLLLLHELGHRTAVFKPDAGAENQDLNRRQTQMVLDACFK